jgi:hypothetical protein
MIGSQRKHFDMRLHMHLHALLENLPMRICQVTTPNPMSYSKVGSTKALNRWDLSPQHVTLTIASFLEVPIKAFIPAILCLH